MLIDNNSLFFLHALCDVFPLYAFAFGGSKRRMLGEIRSLFPRGCNLMVEACCGSAVISINSFRYFDHVIINDSNKFLIELLETLKDAETRVKLIEQLEALPQDMESAKALFTKYHENYLGKFTAVEDKFERAVQTYTVIAQAFMNNPEHSWADLPPKNIAKRLFLTGEALESITITNRSCFDYLEEYKHSPKTFINLDIPYINEPGYAEKWKSDKYTLLAEQGVLSEAKILIFSRSNQYLESVFAESDGRWQKRFVKSLASVCHSSDRDEYIYINFQPEFLGRCNSIQIPFFKSREDLDIRKTF